MPNQPALAPHPAAAPITLTGAQPQTLPLVLAFPHSGDVYPPHFGFRGDLSFAEIDFPADRYVDELFGTAARALGISTLRANFPRAYVDVNRHQHDIDPDMLADPDGWYGRLQPTARIDGSTLFWSRAKGKPIYDRKLDLSEAKGRLATCFIPYHQALTRLVDETRRRFGTVCLLDCHSMTKFDSARRGGRVRPQIDIGTRHGECCDLAIATRLATSFERLGYEVGMNKRFSGGEVTLRYGWPEIDQHALQVELRRDLYMDEETRDRSGRFARMQADCGEALTDLARFLGQRARPAAADDTTTDADDERHASEKREEA